MNTQCCCTKTFSDYVIQCPESLTVYALNLEPATEYTVLLKSAIFPSKQIDTTTDANGYIVIPIIDLPEGFLNQYSGEYELFVYEKTEDETELDACAPIRLLIAKYFDNISFHVKPGDAVKSRIGCPVE